MSRRSVSSTPARATCGQHASTSSRSTGLTPPIPSTSVLRPAGGERCRHNAVSEAFNSVLKVEYVYRHTFATRTEARLRIATWITGFYNTHRLDSVCGYQSPIDYEHNHRANSALELAA
ncbi:integrase core domain-containing protein [Streptomyces rhizosphaerihabitans]|uniref:integrase core domain-containing protein n=1 Tax=Streptomyces rhizosphaerihabitans TaxID=1266770 RepID=UPI0021BE9060|nr:integrase core domain-containing protein [Streptomyces rhizosphaerihabitans]MCT9010789.1 integrase core domain-containing protein [Streptomyces rhizosphaerihabitans]